MALRLDGNFMFSEQDRKMVRGPEASTEESDEARTHDQDYFVAGKTVLAEQFFYPCRQHHWAERLGDEFIRALGQPSFPVGRPAFGG